MKSNQQDGREEKRANRMKRVAKVIKDKTTSAADQIVERYGAGVDATTSAVGSG